MASIWNDFMLAVRKLRRDFLWTSLVVGLLGLGLGAHLVIFSLVDSIVLRPLPYPDAESLVQVWEHDLFNENQRSLAAIPNILDWQERSRSFEDFAFFLPGSGNLRGETEPIRLQEGIVSTNYFDLLGVRPELGRFFRPEEAEKGNTRVAIISHDLWMSWFGGERGIIDRFVNLEGAQYQVIGVLPPGFRYPHPGVGKEPDLWRPIPVSLYLQARHYHFVEVIGRLKADVSLAAAQEEMTSLSRALSEQYPGTNTHRGVSLEPLRSHVSGDLRQPLILLLGSVGLLLLITFSNVGMLMLSRAEARQREVALRTALGGKRWSLLRPMVLESLLLAVGGACLAWALAPFALRAILAADAWQLARMDEIALRLPALGTTLLLVLLTVIVCGLGPALRTLGRRSCYDTLRQDGRAVSIGFKSARWQQGLVVAEVALAILLLFCAGLLTRSYVQLLDVDPGFDTAGGLTASLWVLSVEYQDAAQFVQLQEQLLERLERRHDVQAAAAVNLLPLRPSRRQESFSIDGQPHAGVEAPLAELRKASRGYFSAAGIPLLEGRPFGREDRADSLPVAVISRQMAESFWPGTSPVGRRLQIAWEKSERTIIGVVGDITQGRLEETPASQIYVPLAQIPDSYVEILLRTEGPPMGLVEPLRQAVLELDSTQIPYGFESLEDRYRGITAQPRLFLLVLSIFAAAALSLAALGIYGIMAYHVRRRQHEIGLRMAIGAQRHEVVRLILRRGMTLFAIGGVLGLVLALSFGRLTESLLYEISVSDPWTFVTVGGLTAAVAFCACAVPALRAAGVDPIEALRGE